MNGNNVNPKKWSNIKVLYDDGISSFIIGNYEGKKGKIIAMRWNGDSGNPKDIGYPKQGRYPLWFMLPSFLYVPVLNVLKTSQYTGKNDDCIDEALALANNGGCYQDP